MPEKIKIMFEIDSEDLKLLKELADKMELTVNELLMQELREKLIELDTWEHRFGLLHKKKEN